MNDTFVTCECGEDCFRTWKVCPMCAKPITPPAPEMPDVEHLTDIQTGESKYQLGEYSTTPDDVYKHEYLSRAYVNRDFISREVHKRLMAEREVETCEWWIDQRDIMHTTCGFDPHPATYPSVHRRWCPFCGRKIKRGE
jgi:hypothetical protein